MGIFKPSLDKQIADAVTARDRIASRLTETEIGIADLKAEAERAALSGATDEVLDRVETKMRALVDRAATLRSALKKAEAEVARLERERADAADRSRREEVGAALELVSRECVESAEAVRAAVDRLYACMVKAATIAPEASGLATFSEMARVEIPSGAELIAKLLRQNREQVFSGSAPPRMPVVPEPYVEIIPPPVPTEMLFVLRSIRWIGDDGKQRSAAQFNDVALPVRLVQKALSCGACVPMSDPRRRTHRTQGGTVRLETATDLDAPPAEPEHTAEPVMHSAFEKPVIGEPRILKIAR